MLGDPTWLGIAIAIGYVAVGALAFAKRSATRLPRFFACASMIYVALGINKQADLQTVLLEGGRTLASHELTFVPRVLLRALVVVFVLVALATLGALVSRLVRPSPADAALALAGLVTTGTFVLLRATSFVHFGALHRFFVAHPLAAPLLEVPGIVLFGLGVERARRSRAKVG